MRNSLFFANELLKISLKIVKKSQAEIYQRTLAYIAIAEAYQKLGQPENATSVVKTLLELNQRYKDSDYFTLEEIAKYYQKQGDRIEAIKFLDLALSLVKKIPDSDYEERDNILVRLGDEFARLGEFVKGLECAELIEDDYDRCLLYQYVAHEYINCRQYEQINLVIEKAKETGWENWLLEEIVKSYLEHEDFPRALEAIKKMNQKQAKVNALSDIALKYLQLGNRVQAQESLIQAKKIVERIENSDSKSWSLQAISRASQQIESTDEFNSLLSASVNEAKQIDDIFLQGFAFDNLAFQLASAGKYEEAIKTIESSNPFIPKFEKICLLIQVAKQYQKSNQPAKADKIINLATKAVAEITGEELSIQKEAARSFAWNDIADYALEHDQYNLVWEIFKHIEQPSGKVDLLTKISKKYIKNNQYAEADNALHKAEQILWKMQNKNDLYLATTIAYQYSEIKDYDSAIKVVKKMPCNLQQARALVAIALQYIKSPQKIDPATFKLLKTIA